jgi:hypothetical protein
VKARKNPIGRVRHGKSICPESNLKNWVTTGRRPNRTDATTKKSIEQIRPLKCKVKRARGDASELLKKKKKIKVVKAELKLETPESEASRKC